MFVERRSLRYVRDTQRGLSVTDRSYVTPALPTESKDQILAGETAKTRREVDDDLYLASRAARRIRFSPLGTIRRATVRLKSA